MGHKNFRNAFDFVRAKADVYVRCECGHTCLIAKKDLLKVFKSTETFQSMTRRLKCSLCGKRGQAKVAPVPER